MVIYLWVALGGALGSVGRFWLNGVVTARAGDGFPWGTLLINVLGSFAIGFFATLPATSDTAKRFLMAGICGGFTTFSSFALEFAIFVERDQIGLAAFYVAVSLAAGFAALFAGLWLARGAA